MLDCRTVLPISYCLSAVVFFARIVYTSSVASCPCMSCSPVFCLKTSPHTWAALGHTFYEMLHIPYFMSCIEWTQLNCKFVIANIAFNPSIRSLFLFISSCLSHPASLILFVSSCLFYPVLVHHGHHLK